jgi:hypothetical protein
MMESVFAERKEVNNELPRSLERVRKPAIRPLSSAEVALKHVFRGLRPLDKTPRASVISMHKDIRFIVLTATAFA